MENTERLGRPEFEPGTSRLPVMSATTLSLMGRNVSEFDIFGSRKMCPTYRSDAIFLVLLQMLLKNLDLTKHL